MSGSREGERRGVDNGQSIVQVRACRVTLENAKVSSEIKIADSMISDMQVSVSVVGLFWRGSPKTGLADRHFGWYSSFLLEAPHTTHHQI